MQPLLIKVGARSSKLSRVQVKEVLELMRKKVPQLEFDPIFVESSGDKDKKTSLRSLDKTDFFTKEIDAMVLAGEVSIGIHSAKDLPYPLPKGLQLIALTEGIDPSDSLVMRQGESLKTLKANAVVATSSERREECCKMLREDLVFIDLRGTIEERLKKLDTGEADGVIVAEAALIRLGLTHLNRVTLPGTTASGQGQLAIIAKENDAEMELLFSCIDSR